MNSGFQSRLKFVIAAAFLCSMTWQLMAGQPDDRALDAAIKSGDFSIYLADANAWLKQKTPARPTRADLEALLIDSSFRCVLNQRQLISKTGTDKLGEFAKADPANREFLSWLMKSAPVMELYLEASVPLSLAAREANKYTLNTKALEIWENVLKADADAKEGLCLKLAIAVGIAPPGSVNIGAGGAAKPADPVERYKLYKTAHQKKELFPNFDSLSVWDYTLVVSSGATNEDLTWARQMVNTFRPDLRINQRVIKSTSLVWRRNAPAQFYPAGYVHFKNVLAGGGKCGPRSSWAQMICHSFGIPAVGVRQPRHAAAAYKAANPANQPQPGTAWKVDYGAGWHVSKVRGLPGPEFVAAAAERSDAEKFSRVEHLRWLAAALAPSDRAEAVMAIARAIQKLPGEEKAAAEQPSKTAAPKPAAPITRQSVEPAKAVDGVIRVKAANFAQTGGKISWGGQVPHVLIHESFGGGKQVYFQQQMREQWADYVIDAPAAGIYKIMMTAACINVDQLLEIFSGETRIAVVDIPLSYGLWQDTPPVELKLEKGVQALRVQTPKSIKYENHKRGIALRSFELRPKGK
jgi:hypothetical protein